MLILSPLTLIAESQDFVDDDDDDLYQYNRSPTFNAEIYNLQGKEYIDETEGPDVEDMPYQSQDLKIKTKDCTKKGANDDECQDIDIED